MKHSFAAGRGLREVRLFVSVLGLCALGAACQNKDAQPAPAPAVAPSAAVAPAPSPKPVAPRVAIKKLEWTDPPEWKSVKPSSSMRRASYEIPRAKGDKAAGELNVFVLGGNVEDNITRWVDEFSSFDRKTLVRSDRTVNDMAQAVVELPKGKFSGGMGADGPFENYGLLGAIVITPQDTKYFFKLTGPAATVKAAREPFYRMLDSMRLEGQPAATPGTKAAEVPAKASPAAVASPAKPAGTTPAAPTATPPAAAPTPPAPAAPTTPPAKSEATPSAP